MKAAHASRSSGTAELLAKAADEFLQAAEAGNPPTIDEFVERYPQIAAVLRDVLPALTLMHSSSSESRAKAPSADDLVDRTLGDFRLIREIGRGGMGVVYEAEQISLGRSVALKVLPFAGVLDEKQLQRFKNEARAAAALEHPHIVPVYSVGCERGVHYYAMRFIDGQSLAEILQAIPTYRANRAEDADRNSEIGDQKSDGSVVLTVRREEAARDLQPAAPSPGSTPLTEIQPPSLDTSPNLQALITTNAGFDSLVYFRNVARLGSQVAEALAYAHEQGILHRDIKPGNLLLDVHGNLWIADFGLARLESDAGMTMTGDMLGTLRYMSPEQASGQRVLDERSDVYSLGVTLYELLVLRPAFSGNDRQEILRRIASDDPKPPRQITPRLPRDLETIILRAIAKEPTSRYQTAADFAEDLQRFLSDQPIRARRPTFIEECVKWSRRHPAAVWATILVLLATTIISGISTALIVMAFNSEAAQRQLAQQNEQTANANAVRTKAIAGFMVNAFRSPDSAREGRKITVAELLGRSVRELQDKFSDDPLTKAALLQAIGQSYVGLGLYGESLPLFQQAYDLRKKTAGVEYVDMVQSTESLAMMHAVLHHPDEAVKYSEENLRLVEEKMGPTHHATLNGMHNLAIAYGAAGRYDDALKLTEKTLKLKQATLGPEHRDTLKTSHTLALGYEQAGRLQEGLQLLERTYETEKSVLGAEDVDTCSSAQALGDYYIRLGRARDAIPLLELTRDVNSRDGGPNHPGTLQAMRSLADAYRAVDRTDDAFQMAEQALRLEKADLRLDPHRVLDSMNDLAKTYQETGHLDKALPLYEEALKLAKARLAANDIDMPVFVGNLGQAYRVAGRLKEALPLLEDTFKTTKAALGPDNPETLDYMNNLALAYLDSNRLSEAVPMLEQILKLRRAKLGQTHPDTLNSMTNLADAYRRLGRFDEAIALAEESFTLDKAKNGADHADTLDKLHNLAHAYYDADRLDKAVPRFQELFRLRKAKQGASNLETLGAMLSLAESYLKGNQFKEAIPLLEELLKLEQPQLKPDHPDRLQTMNSLARAYIATQHADEAIPLLEETLKARTAKLGAGHSDTLETMGRLADAYLGTGRAADAEPLARKCLQAAERTAPDDWETFDSRLHLGMVLLAQKKLDEAGPLLTSGYDGMVARQDKMPAQSREMLPALAQVIGELYESSDQPKKAAEWKAKVASQEKK